jgi:hypothetical protein
VAEEQRERPRIGARAAAVAALDSPSLDNSPTTQHGGKRGRQQAVERDLSPTGNRAERTDGGVGRHRAERRHERHSGRLVVRHTRRVRGDRLRRRATRLGLVEAACRSHRFVYDASGRLEFVNGVGRRRCQSVDARWSKG